MNLMTSSTVHDLYQRSKALREEMETVETALKEAIAIATKEREAERLRDGWPREWTWLLYHTGCGTGLSASLPWMFYYRHRGTDETLCFYGTQEHFNAGVPETVRSVGELETLGLSSALPSDWGDDLYQAACQSYGQAHTLREKMDAAVNIQRALSHDE